MQANTVFQVSYGKSSIATRLLLVALQYKEIILLCSQNSFILKIIQVAYDLKTLQVVKATGFGSVQLARDAAKDSIKLLKHWILSQLSVLNQSTLLFKNINIR